jgi:hypothetical protein
LSGILPTSSAVITSTLAPALRLSISERSSVARMPVTTTLSSSAEGLGTLACWAKAGRPMRAAARATGVRRRLGMAGLQGSAKTAIGDPQQRAVTALLRAGT